MIYYIMYQGKVTGPMNREQMAAYNVTADTMVSANGSEDWQPLYKFPELMEIAGNGADYQEFTGYQRTVTFGQAIQRCFSKYCNFTGRASRSEFWWWILFTYILSWAISFLLPGVDYMELSNDPTIILTSPGMIGSGILNLVLLLPTLGVTVRRLHDTGHSGWWYWLNLVLCIGQIILLVWYCKASEPRANEYGPVPNTGEE